MDIPYVFVPSKEQLGSAIGIDIGSAVACIIEAGEAEGMLGKIIDSLSNL